MIYLYIVGYFFIALWLLAIMRVSLNTKGQLSPFYIKDDGLAGSFILVHIWALFWPLIFGIVIVLRVSKKIFSYVITAAENVVIFFNNKLTASKEANKSKKDNTPTTF